MGLVFPDRRDMSRDDPCWCGASNLTPGRLRGEQNPPEKQRDQINRDGSPRIGGFLDTPLAKVEAVDSEEKVDLLWR